MCWSRDTLLKKFCLYYTILECTICTFGLAQSCNFQKLKVYEDIYCMRAFITHSWILTIHKVRNFLVNKEIVFKNGVKNTQATAYNGSRTLLTKYDQDMCSRLELFLWYCVQWLCCASWRCWHTNRQGCSKQEHMCSTWSSFIKLN